MNGGDVRFTQHALERFAERAGVAGSLDELRAELEQLAWQGSVVSQQPPWSHLEPAPAFLVIAEWLCMPLRPGERGRMWDATTVITRNDMSWWDAVGAGWLTGPRSSVYVWPATPAVQREIHAKRIALAAATAAPGLNGAISARARRNEASRARLRAAEASRASLRAAQPTTPPPARIDLPNNRTAVAAANRVANRGTLEFHRETARNLSNLGRDDEAFHHAERWVALAPHDASAVRLMAQLVCKLGRGTKARSEITQQLVLCRRYGDGRGEARGLHSLALVAYCEGALEEARAAFTSLLALRPDLAAQLARQDPGLYDQLTAPSPRRKRRGRQAAEREARRQAEEADAQRSAAAAAARVSNEAKRRSRTALRPYGWAATALAAVGMSLAIAPVAPVESDGMPSSELLTAVGYGFWCGAIAAGLVILFEIGLRKLWSLAAWAGTLTTAIGFGVAIETTGSQDHIGVMLVCAAAGFIGALGVRRGTTGMARAGVMTGVATLAIATLVAAISVR